MSNPPTNYRTYVLEQIDDGLLDQRNLIKCFVNWLTSEDIEDMLEANQLHPRFTDDSWEYEEDTEDDEDEDPPNCELSFCNSPSHATATLCGETVLLCTQHYDRAMR